MKIVIARDGNTSNLRTHIRINHPLTAARMDLDPPNPISTPPAESDAEATATTTYTQPTIMGAFGKLAK